MLDERRVKQTFVTAVNRVAGELEWSAEKCEKFLGVAVGEARPEMGVFDAHAWNVLLRYVKVGADGALEFCFRNGRREVVI